MINPIFIGIDAGTSQIKCVAFEVNGALIATASAANEYHNLAEGGAEQNMLSTRDKVFSTLADLVIQLGSQSTRIQSIAITAQGDGLLLIDQDGTPLHDGWLWLDSRASAIATAIENDPNYDVVFTQTGTAINAAQMRSQMRWIDQHQPELLDKAAVALHWKDYLYYCLTGVCATDLSEALFTFGNHREGDYSTEVLDALKLRHRESLLPPIIDGLERSDTLSAALAAQLNIPATTQVTLGAVDVICAALGGGLYNDGNASAMTILGTTGIHMRYARSIETLQLPKDKTGYTIPFPGGGVVQLQSNMAATLNLDWMLGLGCDVLKSQGHPEALSAMYESLDQHLAETKPSSALYHPYIASAGERGPFVNADARASFIGLEQQLGFYDLVRCVIEGLGFAARDCYEALGELPKEIRLTGGAAQSVTVQTIIASIMNRPVRLVEQTEAAAAGAAMIATVQHGHFENINACVNQWLGASLGAVVQPMEQHIAHYDQLYQVYLNYRKQQPTLWSAMSHIRQGIYA